MRNRLLIATLLLLAVAGIAGIVAGSQNARAHVFYEDGYTYSSSDKCAWGRAEMSHGEYDYGYAKTSVDAKTSGWPVVLNCFYYWSRPINHLRVAADVEWDNGNSWDVCYVSNWYYNGGDAGGLYQEFVWVNETPCNEDGEYRTWSYGDVKNGSSWTPIGGSIVSGNDGHELPAS